MRRQRILFHCQPTLGFGHYVRSRALVQALDEFDVTFAIGGHIPAGFALPSHVEIVSLPALQIDEISHQLSSPDAQTPLSVVQAARGAQLLDAFERIRPAALIIELFPFGRHKFAPELLPLLERARQTDTLIVCSLRDILVSKRDQAAFNTSAIQWANTYFDLLLVHADPQFQRLEETFAAVSQLTCELRYTGFVVAPMMTVADSSLPPFPHDQPLIVTSIGGGRVGYELLACALQAHSLIAEYFPHHMLLLGGPQMPDLNWQELCRLAAGHPGVSVAPYVINLPALLQRAALSISLAGYNTCMDVLTTGVRAVMYPYTGNNNQEQTMRAARLAAAGRLRLLPAGSLSPNRLATEAQLALQTPASTLQTSLSMQGAIVSATILKEFLQNTQRV